MTTQIRDLAHVIPSIPTSDGAGVKLRRSIGSQRGLYLDPFLMLDEFGTENPGDYIAGFPPHPHRGFETVTYMLDGRMQHKDHMGNTGDLGPGSAQWMTAARGIIHSEMPLQESGRMRGFQLWVNLPSAEKMKSAGYRDIPASDIPELLLPQGGKVKVIAGTAEAGGEKVSGPINGPDKPLSTNPYYFDIELPMNARFDHALPDGHNAFVYAYEGKVKVGAPGKEKPLPTQAAGILGQNGTVSLVAGEHGARIVLIAGKPINEPVVQYGPFVMNTREEIEQALRDYSNGTLAAAA